MFVLHDRAVDFLVRLTSIQTVMGFEIFDSDEREEEDANTHKLIKWKRSDTIRGTSVCIYIDMVFLRLAL
jgi:hypothetical protein